MPHDSLYDPQLPTTIEGRHAVFPLQLKKQDVYLHPDLKFWTYMYSLLIANGDYIDNCGRF